MAESEKDFSTAPQWIDLPADVTANILHRLGALEILENAQRVCTYWWRICQRPAMWRVINITINLDWKQNAHALCRRAVDLSQGHLVDLRIEYLCNITLLNYIFDRSSELKRLTLHSCNLMYGGGLGEVMKKVPQLEELHLNSMYNVYASDIETIAKACPLLNSFTFNLDGIMNMHRYNPHRFEKPCRICNNGRTLAIAENMPNLRHLSLFSLPLNDKGLEAILDGCPRLESLDLRQCFHLDGTLSKRCYEQIKHVKFPFDSIKDVGWLKASVDSDLNDYAFYEWVVGLEHLYSTSRDNDDDDESSDSDGRENYDDFDDDYLEESSIVLGYLSL